MNPEQLKEYNREKSKKFNANLRELRLKDKEKKRTADQQPDNQGTAQGTAQGSNQGNLQGSNQGNQPDGLTLQDLMDIYETLDTKMDIIQTKLETIMENKLYEPLETKMDIIQNKLETIIENKISEETFKTKLENNTLLPQFKPVLFA